MPGQYSSLHFICSPLENSFFYVNLYSRNLLKTERTKDKSVENSNRLVEELKLLQVLIIKTHETHLKFFEG